MVLELSAVSVTIITLAAALYVGNQLAEFMNYWRKARINRIIAAFEKIHEAAFDDVDNVSFDLYWDDVSDVVKQHVKESNLLMPEELRDIIPTEMLDHVIQPQVREARSIARHLAAHARMGNKEASFAKKLPKMHREALTQIITDHEKDLDKQRSLLISVGVDVSALERHFASQ